MSGTERVSPYNLTDLKNTTDDALANYLRGLSFKQDNTKLDIRLVTGYVAVIIAAALFAADYKLGWEATKGWTAVAVLAYAALNGFFTYWLCEVLDLEKKADLVQISVSSRMKKHVPTYYLSVKTSSGTDPVGEIEAPFTTWFTADGFFVAQPFQQWVAGSVGVIGDLDAKNAMRDQRDELAAPTAKVSVLEDGAGSMGADNGKGSKRGKRKG